MTETSQYSFAYSQYTVFSAAMKASVKNNVGNCKLAVPPTPVAISIDDITLPYVTAWLSTCLNFHGFELYLLHWLLFELAFLPFFS